MRSDFDENYSNAILKLNFKVSVGLAENAQLQFKLTDKQGKEVELTVKSYQLKSKTVGVINIPIKAPLKWNAEQPNLYTLTATLVANENIVETRRQKVGFREITILGNLLMVNGKNVKLRGTCRHDVSSTLGRCTTPELDEADVKLIKEANLNFVRTSHYPPSQAFLDFCDQYGLYVEEETAVCFTKMSRKKIRLIPNVTFRNLLK
ncbi:MAG: hypothetical protein HC905_12315 [Bacteroidales bacterium]|nr:hypothetical protein [Bacteroidales bacterium]